MKKYLSLLLCFSLFVALFSSCRKGAEMDDDLEEMEYDSIMSNPMSLMVYPSTIEIDYAVQKYLHTPIDKVIIRQENASY